MEHRLTAAKVRSLRTPGRYGDGGGLMLEVRGPGSRHWILRVVVQGRRRDIGLGSASLVSLAEAREKARELRAIARRGGNPLAERDAERAAAATFAEVAREYHAAHVLAGGRNEKHRAQWLASLEAYALPHIGARPVGQIGSDDVLRVLAPVWREKPETARRVMQRRRVVLDYAAARGLREDENAVATVVRLRALPRQGAEVAHHAALPFDQLPALWPRLVAAPGMGALALRLAILTAARSGEVRGARWDEIDVDAALWIVRPERMKGGRLHRVPLAPAALEVLAEARRLAGAGGKLLFPSARPGRPPSDMTLAAVLKRLGVQATVHGMRSAFRDWAAERGGAPREVAELALAHQVGSAVERAYARSDRLDERRDLLIRYSEFVTGRGES